MNWMEKRALGKTELCVSRAGFGVLALGETHKAMPDEEGADLLMYGLSRGISFYDTAEYYDEYPLMKRFIEEAEAAGIGREEMVISCKSLASDYSGMKSAVDHALDEMGLEYIDIFLMHEVRPGQLPLRRGAWHALQEAKLEGKVRAIGLSTHHVDVAGAAASGGVEGCDCVFALLNIEGLGIRCGEPGGPGGALPGYWTEDRAGARDEMEQALGACHDAGIGVFIMKVLGGGNLAADYRKALDYAFSLDFVDSVMLGMSSAYEVDSLISYMEGELPEDYRPDLNEKILKVNHDDCVGCGECMRACGQGAIAYGENGLAVIDLSRCIDCGYCAYACPTRAIIRV